MRTLKRHLVLVGLSVAVAFFLVAWVARQRSCSPVNLGQVKVYGLNNTQLMLVIEDEHCMTEPSESHLRWQMAVLMEGEASLVPYPGITAVRRTNDPAFPYEVEFAGELVRAKRVRSGPWWAWLLRW
jgi:hypothetical protein